MQDPTLYSTLPVGTVIKVAIEKGLRVHELTFPDETYIDIGTPVLLLDAVRAANSGEPE